NVAVITTNRAALTSGEPTRLTALLIAEPSPALRTGIELINAVVKGATSNAIPRPNTVWARRTSMRTPAGGTQLDGSPTSSIQVGESAGMRASHSNPAAMISGPMVMNARGPNCADQRPAGVDSVVSRMATGTPITPAASG